ncbi:MAG TPA: hypothetical protein VN578_20850 [Candidatus Binatia bacterium]|jgi:hypothetical protein|nr:hypothetical protein [Candidatus Binatia bacterium]
MTACPVIAHIWDYGWLAADDVEVPGGSSDGDVLEHYLASPAFHTSFLPSDKNETGIHGPFLADRIAASDFVPFQQVSMEGYLKALLYSPEWETPATPEQFAEVLAEPQKPFAQGMRCFLLRFDESYSDLHHDWGFVLTVFREFLFLGQRPGLIRRFVIGYD